MTRTADEATNVQLWGGSMSFLATGPDHFVTELTAEVGFAPTPHVHRRHEELFYVVAGEFDFLVGQETVRVGQGGFVCVPPGTVHDFRNPGPGPARMLGIVTPGGFDRYFLRIQQHVLDGTFTPEVLAALRTEYDTDQRDVQWSYQGGL